MQTRIDLRPLFQTLLVTFTALCMISLAGCGGGGITTSTGGSLGAPTPGPITLQSIEKCITNTNNDVIVGSQSDGAKPGCNSVNAAPNSATAQFGDIIVKSGGLLDVPGSTNGAHTLIVSDICLENGSHFSVGSQSSPITSQNKFTIIFTGLKADTGSSGSQCQDSGPSHTGAFKKGIDVTNGATLELYGAKGIPQDGGVSWTTLASPAGSSVPGAKVPPTGLKTLDLTADVTQGAEGWQPGDWIVVATTTFNPEETEFVQIASVASNSPSPGSTIRLKQPLKYYHFGSPAPSTGASAACADRLGNPGPNSYCDGASKNYGVDERAEVGLISRDIELIAQTPPPSSAPPPATTSEHWGGEIKIHQGFTQVAIQGVRLSKFGKDQLGSYPIHFHRAGNIATSSQPALINADSVDHSYNKCVTVHATSNLTISNLVCARIVGHIFYEELNSAGNNNIAGDSNITFKNDLGLGAMSNSFDINGPVKIALNANGKYITLNRQQLIDQYWWAGDYMTNAECLADGTCISYDGFNIPDTDNQSQNTHGSCFTYGANGILTGASAPPCTPGTNIYAEPATGFWIQNPDTNLIGDAIGGCQGVGNGFWWVTPPITPEKITVNNTNVDLRYQPLGTVENDRASACYSGFINDASVGNVLLGLMQPRKLVNGLPTSSSPSVIATLDGITATRNRFRGLWLRPTWFVVKNGRFATNRDNVTLLTSGGIDGNAPGVWELLEDSVLVGLSENNVERWGPCPYVSQTPDVGGEFGCIDFTPSTPEHSGDQFDNGYQTPKWNSAGYYLYDGPVRVFHDRFVNFNYNKGWTTSTTCSDTNAAFYQELDAADCQYLQSYEATNSNANNTKGPPTPYEGDAAFGWFLSNQNSYPTGTASRQLSFVNTNLRHQVFTSVVGIGGVFNDGDKNTAIIDEDGTLSGLGVQLATNSGTRPVHAISLNNLPFNSTSNSVDECLSRGEQNQKFEGRTSALMSPESMGSLQFSSLYPYSGSSFPGGPTGTNSHWQQVSFTRDDLAIKAYPASTAGYSFPAANMYPMAMRTGRGGLGSYEPKVSNGYGYTVTVAPTTVPTAGSSNTGKAGLAHWVDITLSDIVDPNISKAHPFYIRLGIDYATAGSPGTSMSANMFTIKRGYKSYEGNISITDQSLLKYWTNLNCQKLDSQNLDNLPTMYGGKGYCPAASGSTTAPVPVSTLSAAASISELTNSDGTPNLKKFYYNPATGYLYLNIVQDEPNPIAPSPTGDCKADGTGDPACPDINHGETYYACPKNGCVDYTITLNDASYAPGTSTGAPAKTDLKPAPASENKLVLTGTNTVVAPVLATDDQGVPYYTASTTTAPACGTTQPPQP